MYCTRHQVILSTCWLSIVLVLMCNVFIFAHAAAEPKQDLAFSEEDKQFLDKLIAEFLFDPIGAQRISIKDTRRNVWGEVVQITVEGWLVPGDGVKPATIFS